MKRSYTYLKGLLTLALAAFTGWMWAGVTSSFGVNFTHGDNQNLNADDKVGYTTDGYAVPDAWYNLRGSANGNSTITVENQPLNVYWTAYGASSNQWNSGWSTDTLKGKLLLGFLDDCINSSRTKATVTIKGLPLDKKYAVAVILAGDANNDGANGKYSPALINGQTYSYVTTDGVTSRVSGDAATADNAKTWGDRRKVTAGGPSDLTEGQNVMFVEGLSGSELSVTSAMDELDTSRFTIAGVQVWITDEATGVVVTEVTKTLSESGTLSSLSLPDGENTIANINVTADGAKLTIDGTQTLHKINVISTGAVTIVVNANALTNVGTLDCSDVAGIATYEESGYYSAIPFEKLSGIDVIKKTGDSTWTPNGDAIAKMGNSDLYLANGSMSVNYGGLLTNVGVITVDGATLASTVNDPLNNSDQEYADGLVLKNGATVTSTKHMRLPETVTVSGAGSKMSVNGVNSNMWRSISIRKVVLEENATATFTRSEAMAENANAGYHLWNSEFTIGSNATLTIDAPLMRGCNGGGTNDNGITGLTKKGAGELIITAPTSDTDMPDDTVISVEAGTLTLAPTSATYDLGGASIAISNDAIFRVTGSNPVTMSQNISGAGKIVADGAGVTLNLVGATLADTLSYEIASGATLILPAGKEGDMTVPSGCTLKLALSANDKVNGYKSNATINVGGTIAFVEADGSTPVTGDAVNGGTYTPLAPTWTPTSAESLWGNSNLWTNCEDVPTSGEVVVDYSALATDINVTIPEGQFGTVTLKGGESNKATLQLAESVTVGKISVLNNAVLPVALANDANVTIVTTETATLTIDVAAENTTLTKALTIDGALVKGGAGALTMDANFKGAVSTTVGAGTLKYGNVAYNGDITVGTDATLDYNGKPNGDTGIVTLEEGAFLVNNGDNIGSDQKQLVGVVLNGDATIGGSGNFGLIAGQWGATQLDLNGHKLTKTGANGFWICNTTVSAGEFNIESGRIAFENPSGNPKTTTINNIKVTIADANNAALDYTNGTINWNGDVTKAGAGTWNLIGSFVADKTFEIEEGTVSVGGDVTLNRTISGTGTLAVTATGILKDVLLDDTVNLQLAEGARIAFKNVGEVDLGTRTITVNATNEPAEGRNWTVFSKYDPQSGHNGDNHSTLSNVTLKGNGKVAFAGVTGDGAAKLKQTLNVANDSDFSGEIVVINIWNRPIQASLAGEQLKNAVYNFDYNDTDPTESEVQDGKKKLVKNADGVYAELLLTGDATLAGLKGGVRTADQMLNGAGNDRVRSNSGDARTLTLNVPAGATPESGAIIGTANNPVALVKTGAGKQTFTAAVTLAGLSVQAGEVEFAGATTISGNVYSTGTITGNITLADATLTNAIEVTGDVTVAGALNITHATKADDVVIICNNAADIVASLPTAPATLKYEIVNGNTIKLAVAKVNVTIPAAPANTKWYDADGNVVEAGTIAVDPNTNVTLTLKADDGYVFADGSTSTTVTVNSGAEGAEITTPDVTAATPVAQVGETKYQTLQAAVDAADAGAEITVIANIVTDGPISVTKTVTVNLGGKTITATNDTVGDGVFYVVEGGDLTLTGDGTVNALGPNDWCMAVWADGGNVTIEGGTYTNEGAQDNGSGAHFDLIYVKNGGSIEITGGTFKCQTPAWTLNSHNTLKGTISITGGKFYALNPADIDTDDGVTTWCADDYTAVAGEGEDEGYYVVTKAPADAQAKIGGLYYDTLEEAIEAAAAGQTITLLADVTVDGVSNRVVIDEAITLDGNGCTITATNTSVDCRAINIKCDGTVKIQNLTVVAAGERAINVITYPAVLTMDKVTLTAANYAVNVAGSAGAAKVTITNSTLNGLNIVNVGAVGAQVLVEDTTLNLNDTKTEPSNGFAALSLNKDATNASIAANRCTFNITSDDVSPSVKAKNGGAEGGTITIDGYSDEVGNAVALVLTPGSNYYLGCATLEEAIQAAKAGQIIQLCANVTASAPVIVPAGVTLDLNGKTSKGTILGKIAVNGGTYITAESVPVIGTNARAFETTDAVFTMDAVAGNITLNAGTVTAKAWDNGNNWTLPGQALVVKSGVTLTVPAEVTMQVNGTSITIENGATLNIAGKINLYSADATVKAAADLNVTTTVAGCEVKHVEGVYTVVESIVVPPAIAEDENIPAETKEAIKDAMEAAGVTEIESYTITTKREANSDADADEVAAVLEVFDVTPTVDKDGVLTVAYEFGISSMTNEGEVITITAGVTGAEYRAGVAVVFYADGEVIGTTTTTADSTEVSITANAGTINGKKITVKAATK